MVSIDKLIILCKQIDIATNKLPKQQRALHAVKMYVTIIGARD